MAPHIYVQVGDRSRVYSRVSVSAAELKVSSSIRSETVFRTICREPECRHHGTTEEEEKPPSSDSAELFPDSHCELVRQNTMQRGPHEVRL